MDIELVPLMIGMGVGALFGAKGKGAMKSIAKGYFAFLDRAREWTASAREDMRDAIEEAKYERTHESSHDDRTDEQHAPSRASRASANGKPPTKTTRKRTTTTGTRSRSNSSGTRSRATKSAESREAEEMPKAA